MPLHPPLLSAADPILGGEGSVDPFTTQAAYERLAERIFPSITVRMKRIRMVTASCVTAWVCSTDELFGQLAKDGVTPSWLVFEWYLLEAHCRAGEGFAGNDTFGLAGWTKVRRAIQEGRAINAATYLRTPRIFGINGIYRRLATAQRFLTDDMRLDEQGYELLRIWEKEQGLKGFLSGRRNDGPGAGLLADLRDAVKQGLREARTARSEQWMYWKRLPEVLQANRIGRDEARFLFDTLMSPPALKSGQTAESYELRREMIEHMRAHGEVVDRPSERAFLRGLIRKGASPALRPRLQAIDAFESLCAPVDDAFNLALALSKDGPLTARAFAKDQLAQGLPERLRAACDRALATPTLLEHDPEVASTVQRLTLAYEDARKPEQVFEATLGLHEDAQRNKPPNGKRPWTERLGGSVIARPQYRPSQRPSGEEMYVHEYRMPSVSQFLKDLRRGAGS
ncbi:MAG: hypothetical protein ACKO3S_02275 [bacterium]